MNLDLYVLTDEGLGRGRSHTEIALHAILGGADAIQLREKARPARDILKTAQEIRGITEKSGTLFLVNDRLDIALASGADGVHLGQADLPLCDTRAIAPRPFIIGISVGSAGEAQLAERDGADYVALSPLFPTGSKPDAGPGGGLAVLREIRSSITIPVVAIGGITPGNVRDTILAGADGIAVISAVVSQEDITIAARDMKNRIREAKAERERQVS